MPKKTRASKPRAKPRSAPKKKRGGARKGAGRKRKTHLAAYADVGQPPADPLRAVEWGMQLLTVMLEKVKTDPDLSEAKRRAEMRSLLRNMKDLLPTARISQAERTITEHLKRRERPPSSSQGSEELSDASVVGPPPIAASPRRG